MSTTNPPPSRRERDNNANNNMASTPGGFQVDTDANGLPAPTPISSQSRGSISSFLFLTFMLFMLTSGGDDIVIRNHYKETLTELMWEKGNFTGWLNGTRTGDGNGTAEGNITFSMVCSVNAHVLYM